MLEFQLIGIGAAGNKAAIEAIESKVVSAENVMLINSTLADVPDKYLKGAGCTICEISNSDVGGCGKNYKKGERLCLEAMQNGKIDIDSFVKPTTKFVVIVASLEGGTGCGAQPVIAHYIKEELGVPVIVYGFLGFEEDNEGSKNIINWFKRLPEDISVHCISNKNFLDSNRGNYSKAEQAANIEFAIQLSIIAGNCIKKSDQNIDQQDLLNLVTDPKYSIIEYREIDEHIKNADHFSSILKNMIDNSKSLRVESHYQHFLGVIVNIPSADTDNIDYSFKEIISRYGIAEKKFKHIQSYSELPTFIAFISTGMQLPLEEIQAVYDRYVKSKSAIDKDNTDKNSFFSKMVFDDDDEELAPVAKNKKKSFFESYGVQTPNVPSDDNLDSY